MASWNYNPNEYTERTFAPVPEGDHRVIINNVVEKIFSSGNEGFEITLDVSGFDSKLWYYLVFDPNDSAKTNQRIGMFFDSFGIQDHDFARFGNWIGKEGAVRVKHNMYNGNLNASVAFCLSRSQQSRLFTPRANPVVEQTPVNNAKSTSINTTPKRDYNGFSF